MTSSGEPRPVDLLIRHGTVLTVDAADTVITDGTLAVRDGEIVAVGPDESLAGAFRAAETLDATGCFVLPGMVNAHAHLAMTMFRGYADDMDLQGFLDRMFPVEERVLSYDTVSTGVRLALAESVLAGITATLDMFWHPEAAVEAATDIGFRLHCGPTFVTFPGPDHRPFRERMAWARRWLEHRPTQGPVSGSWVMPHATYTLSLEELRAIRDLGREFDCRMHVHAAENTAEVELVRSRSGRRPVELLADLGMLDDTAVLAHAVDLADHEIRFMADVGTSMVHCPLSNLKLASGFARVPDLLRAGAAVALGTDGTASSNDLDLWMAMRFAATIHKARAGDATLLPAAAILRMATMGGAKVLGIDDVVGSLETGKRADVVVVDGDRPHLVPSFDAASTLVYAAGRGDVRDVFVDGRSVVRDHRCVTVDVPAEMAAMRRLGARISAI